MGFLGNKGFWAALFAGFGSLSFAFGKPAAGAVLADPNTAAVVTGLITTVLGFVAAWSAPPAPKA
jgi:hypothetical protein